jgi:hypothetical protein
MSPASAAALVEKKLKTATAETGRADDNENDLFMPPVCFF